MARLPDSIELYCRAACEYGASELILQADSPPAVRVSGNVTPMEAPVVTLADMASIRLLCAVPESANEYSSSFVSSEGVRFGANFQRNNSGERVVLTRVGHSASASVQPASSPDTTPTPIDQSCRIQKLLQSAVTSGASDFHLCAGLPPCVRISGKITPLPLQSVTKEECRDMIMGILKPPQRARLEKELELDFGFQVEGAGRFRGNAHFSRGALEASFRHIPDHIPSLDELGHRSHIGSLCKLNRGLVLVAGMTGAGKTTTMAAMIHRIIETRNVMIVTIEDPIEFNFESSRSIIKQREIGTDTKSFSDALRHVLRQDPDVVVIGEMRDQETVRAALNAAQTGHLVLATLHTNDAPQALVRMTDLFPPEEREPILRQLSNTLAGAISQRLVPSEDGQNQVMVSEFLSNNSAVSACIREQRFEQIVGLMQSGRADGMYTFDDMLEELYLGRRISKEEAVAGARDHSRMEALMRSPGKGA